MGDIGEIKNLGWCEICISFGILVALGVICLCLVWVSGRVGYTVRVGHTVPIWVMLSTATILVGPYVLSRIKRLKDNKVAKFGKKLWYFPNLWYVVFLVGLYVTVTDVAERVIEKPPEPLDVSILLIAARNVVLAAFLAVITSVLAHTFGKLSESAGKIDGALKKLGAMTNKVKNLEFKVSGSGSAITSWPNIFLSWTDIMATATLRTWPL